MKIPTSIRAAKKFARNFINSAKVKNKPKIFCIGANKTGTTSFKKAFNDLDYVVGHQRDAERLLRSYKNNDFGTIIKYCRTAQVFQDFPFSFPETFKHLDLAFPGAKFVLTLRDTPEQWHRSLINFFMKLSGTEKIPTKEEMLHAQYVWKGWMWEAYTLVGEEDYEKPFDKERFIRYYNEYNQSVIDYFRDRPNDFIVINVGEAGSYQRLMDFLGIKSPFSSFPWENKTSELKRKKTMHQNIVKKEQ